MPDMHNNIKKNPNRHRPAQLRQREEDAAKNAFVERRQKKDWVTQAVPIIGAIGWGIAIVALFFYSKSVPAKANIFTDHYGLTPNSVWDTTLFTVAIVSLVLTLVFCAVAMFFNMRRHRRKSDRYNKAVIVLGISSIAMIAIAMLNYNGLL